MINVNNAARLTLDTLHELAFGPTGRYSRSPFALTQWHVVEMAAVCSHLQLPVASCFSKPSANYLLLHFSIRCRDFSKMAPTPTPEGTKTFALCLAFTILSSLTVFARLFTRAVLVRNCGRDDYIIALSWV